MAKSNQQYKFSMVFYLPVMTLFLLNSFFFFYLKEHFILILNCFALLFILTIIANAWNRFIDRFESELKLIKDEADSVNCSAQLLDLELRKIETPGAASLQEINQKLKELLLHCREEGHKGGPVGLAHLKMAKELAMVCSQLNGLTSKVEISQNTFILIDCMQLNSKKIKSHLEVFIEPIPKTKTKVKKLNPYARPVHI